MVMEAPVQTETQEEEKPIEVSFKFEDALLMSNLFGVVEKLASEVTLRLSPESLCIREMDAAHISMVLFKIPKAAFETWNVDVGVDVTLNTVYLRKIMWANAKKGDSVTLRYTSSTMQKLCEVELRGRTNRTYEVTPLDNMEAPPIPKIDFDVTRYIEIDALLELLRSSQKVDNAVKFQFAEKQDFLISAKGDYGKFTGTLNEDDVIGGVTEHPATAIFNAELLIGIFSTMKKLADVMTVSLSDEKPMRASLVLPSNINLDYYLAPRVES